MGLFIRMVLYLLFGGMAGYGQAMKLSSEFVAGIAVGAGIGWLLDSVAGTSPWGLIIFLLLGFAAGVLNVLRAAGVVAEAMVALVLARAVLEKFGGDSVAETRRNIDSYNEYVAQRLRFQDAGEA